VERFATSYRRHEERPFEGEYPDRERPYYRGY
jgi:hypothetical protein